MGQNVCIIGGGNIGVATAVDLSARGYAVTILSHKARTFASALTKVNIDTGESITVHDVCVTDDDAALGKAQIVIVTVPSFAVETVIKRIEPYKPVIVFFFPGYGGKDILSEKLADKGIIIAGLDRVPCIARLKDNGTVAVSPKKILRCAALDRRNTEYACILIEDFFGIDCERVSNYLVVCLTPSNPILHTARLYSMFKDCSAQSIIPRQIKFYAEWTDLASQVMIDMDKELDNVCRVYESAGIDMSSFINIRNHYESQTVKAMTDKICSIKAFTDILSPLKKMTDGTGYVLDLSSRYFTEDFMYGLVNIKDYACACDVATPAIDAVLSWYAHISGEDVPRRSAFRDVESVKDFYNKERNMRMISFDEIAALGITPATCVKWARDAIVHKSEWTCPKKINIPFDDECYYTTMPSFWPSHNVFGVKIVSRIPNRTLPLKADILLYAARAGELLAYMDGTWITAMRTGAVAAITADALKKDGAHTYGFIGLGNIARTTLLCLDAIMDGKDIDVVLLRYKDQHEQFMERFKNYSNIHFKLCSEVENVIGQSDVLFSCVTSMNGIFADEKCFGTGITVIPVNVRGFQNCDVTFDRVFCDDKSNISHFKYYAKFKRLTEMTDVLSEQIVDRTGYTPLMNVG